MEKPGRNFVDMCSYRISALSCVDNEYRRLDQARCRNDSKHYQHKSQEKYDGQCWYVIYSTWHYFLRVTTNHTCCTHCLLIPTTDSFDTLLRSKIEVEKLLLYMQSYFYICDHYALSRKRFAVELSCQEKYSVMWELPFPCFLSNIK